MGRLSSLLIGVISGASSSLLFVNRARKKVTKKKWCAS